MEQIIKYLTEAPWFTATWGVFPYVPIFFTIVFSVCIRREMLKEDDPAPASIIILVVVAWIPFLWFLWSILFIVFLVMMLMFGLVNLLESRVLTRVIKSILLIPTTKKE